jgi:transposase
MPAVAEQDARSLSQDAQEALRMQGVRLVVDAGWTQVAVAEALGVNERVVGRWVKRYREGGYAGLAKRPRGRKPGEHKALTRAQQDRVVQSIIRSGPDQLRLPGRLWTRASVQALIAREAGVMLDLTSVGRYLRSWGFAPDRPAKGALGPSPAARARSQEFRRSLERVATREGALIVWSDEPHVPGGRMVRATAGGGHTSFRVYAGEFGAGAFIDFLDRLMATHPGRTVYLVVDGHRTHRAPAVQEWVAAEGRAGRLQLVFRPHAVAPD